MQSHGIYCKKCNRQVYLLDREKDIEVINNRDRHEIIPVILRIYYCENCGRLHENSVDIKDKKYDNIQTIFNINNKQEIIYNSERTGLFVTDKAEALECNDCGTNLIEVYNHGLGLITHWCYKCNNGYKVEFEAGDEFFDECNTKPSIKFKWTKKPEKRLSELFVDTDDLDFELDTNFKSEINEDNRTLLKKIIDKIIKKEVTIEVLGNTIIRDAVENYLNNLNQRDKYQLRNIGNINEIMGICIHVSESDIDERYRTNRRIREILLELKETIKQWDFNEQLKEAEEKLKDIDVELECHYDFSVNKWNIKRKMGRNKDKEYNIWFSTFGRMNEYMLSEMRW